MTCPNCQRPMVSWLVAGVKLWTCCCGCRVAQDTMVAPAEGKRIIAVGWFGGKEGKNGR